MTTLAVGLGELKASRTPGDVLICYGLGSCIGCALYDPVLHVGALVHVVLPDSSLSRGPIDLPGKFADTAIPAAIAAVVKLGGKPGRLLVRFAGGARMLNVAGINSRMDIGARNAEAVRTALQQVRLGIAGTDTGGSHGRTMSVYIGTGRVVVSTVGRGEKVL